MSLIIRIYSSVFEIHLVHADYVLAGFNTGSNVFQLHVTAASYHCHVSFLKLAHSLQLKPLFS